jgi:EAL domain-containing protein (putative c-di-GMP-specific phosphodiesterase class I)
VVGSAEVSMLASVGVSISHDPEAEPEDLLREADVAMYRAKGSGGHNLELFNEDLRREASARLELEDRLEHALPRHELLLEYQPLVKLAGGKPVGCEALVRWHPHGGEPMPPLDFLSLAEESELIVQIGDWVLHTACAQAAAWRRDGIEMTVSVNVSARELTGADLAERVKEALKYCQLPGKALCLEVSEEVLLRDPARARAVLKDVKRLGVAIALDNFGAQQSTLSLPGSLPLSMLKLDRTLIQGFERDKERRAMVVATLALARESGLTAVVVGIETNRQLALARELDCSVGQGFLLHRPNAPEGLRLREAPGTIRLPPPWRPIVRLRGTHRH